MPSGEPVAISRLAYHIFDVFELVSVFNPAIDFPGSRVESDDTSFDMLITKPAKAPGPNVTNLKMANAQDP